MPLSARPLLYLLHEQLSRDHLSAMSAITAITLEGKLYITFQERSFKGEDAVRFLQHLMHQIEGKLLVVWDGSPIHRGRAVKDFLASGASSRGASSRGASSRGASSRGASSRGCNSNNCPAMPR